MFEIGSLSSANCLTVGIIFFDNTVELGCVLACFGGKGAEISVFFFVDKISVMTVVWL